MNLIRSPRTKVIHIRGCDRSGVAEAWDWGTRYIQDIPALSGHTKAFPLIHVDSYCLPGYANAGSAHEQAAVSET